MSPPSLFPTSQRFPIPLPVMTSLDQSEARKSAIWAHFTTSVSKTNGKRTRIRGKKKHFKEKPTCRVSEEMHRCSRENAKPRTSNSPQSTIHGNQHQTIGSALWHFFLNCEGNSFIPQRKRILANERAPISKKKAQFLHYSKSFCIAVCLLSDL